jgi:hypothetical protein
MTLHQKYAGATRPQAPAIGCYQRWPGVCTSYQFPSPSGISCINRSRWVHTSTSSSLIADPSARRNHPAELVESTWRQCPPHVACTTRPCCCCFGRWASTSVCCGPFALGLPSIARTAQLGLWHPCCRIYTSTSAGQSSVHSQLQMLFGTASEERHSAAKLAAAE